jgi:hypothetical protein
MVMRIRKSLLIASVPATVWLPLRQPAHHSTLRNVRHGERPQNRPRINNDNINGNDNDYKQ